MPKFKFALDNGKFLTLEGDTQPSDTEVEALAKEHNVRLQPAHSTDAPADIPDTPVHNPSTQSEKPHSEEVPTDNSNPVETPTHEPEKPSSGWLSSMWHHATDPLTNIPSKFAESIANHIDQPVNRDDSYLSGVAARAKGFLAGSIKGIGDLTSGLTSPLNLVTTAATLGSGPALEAGMPAVSKGLTGIARMASAPVVAHGAYDILNPESSIQQRVQGAIEASGGMAAMLHSPTLKSEVPTSEALPTVGGAEVQNSRTNPRTGEVIIPGKTGVISPDPNLNGGMGNPELAGSEPYKAPTEPQYKMGTKVVIKSNKATPELVKQARAQGFEFDSINDQGDFRFTKTSEPTPKQPILESEVGTQRLKLGPSADTKKDSMLAEAANFPRTVMASMDMSAPLRQGLGLIHKPEFWKAIPGMFKAFGSEDAFQQIQKSIADKPLFKPRVGPDSKILPSFADDAGLKLTDLNDISKREESIMSSWAEKIPGVRASNRAYTGFLNKLRADTFESLIQEGKIFGADGTTNVPLAKELANFVNTATGRGDLGKLEGSAKALSSVLFSPRLIASRVQMLNPHYYMYADPMVRKEALKSLFSIAAAGNIFTQLGRMAGGTVESDPASSDFGKLKMGNTRFDPYGGFQQYIVAAQRLMPEIDLSSVGMGKVGGHMKSTETNREYSLSNPKFGQSNRADVAMRFLRGKTNPIINFAWGLLSNKRELSGDPMNMTTLNPMENAVAQRFIPMVMQDIYDLYNESTAGVGTKIAAGALSTFGMGTQTYGK